jgi:hypothetical protein
LDIRIPIHRLLRLRNVTPKQHYLYNESWILEENETNELKVTQMRFDTTTKHY